jgi:hypothetical protein
MTAYIKKHEEISPKCSANWSTVTSIAKEKNAA